MSRRGHKITVMMIVIMIDELFIRLIIKLININNLTWNLSLNFKILFKMDNKAEELDNPISPEKDDKITKIVNEELASNAYNNQDLKAIETKLSDIISKKMEGESWICLMEYQPG
jgi:hypothetical protein